MESSSSSTSDVDNGTERDRGRRRVFICSSSNRSKKRINKKEIFGVSMLIIVDLIWVGSAGLTRYLFHQESYDKPFFTVYFKTILFTIYLLPFIFWRPWQRLCCCSCCRREKRRSVIEPIQVINEGETEDGDRIKDNDAFKEDVKESEKSNGKESKDEDSILISSMDSFLASPPPHQSYLLGPSVYKPLRSSSNGLRSDEEEEITVGHDSFTKSHSPSRSIQQEEPVPIISTSDTFINKRKRLSRVRFSHTVEVKHVPTFSDESSRKNKKKTLKILNVRQVISLSIPFGILWFFANYLYAIALDHQSVAVVNTLSSLSGILVLILAAIPPRVAPKDRFTLTKLLIIIISLGGAVLVGLAPQPKDPNNGISYTGSLFTVGGAVLYASYLVLLSKAVPNEENLEIPMFFGFAGVAVSVMITPLILLWDFVKWEEFELPPNNMVWTLLLINGFVGTVLSELLWLWGCLLTSSLVGTLSLSLVTPLSITYSIVIGEASVSVEFIMGSLMMIVSFVLVAVVNHWSGWDPLWNLIKYIVIYTRTYRSHSWYQILNSESQSLLAERAEGRGGGGSDDGVEDNVASADSSINFSPDLL